MLSEHSSLALSRLRQLPLQELGDSLPNQLRHARIPFNGHQAKLLVYLLVEVDQRLFDGNPSSLW